MVMAMVVRMGLLAMVIMMTTDRDDGDVCIKRVDNYVHDRAFGVFHEAVRKVERLGQLSEVWYERDSPAGSLQFEEVA